ncbi:MAG: hypothetical protein ACI4OL_06500 [Gemmiger sp.]
MHYSFYQNLASDYQADLLAAIEEAKQGNLPPSKQEHCFGEIAKARGTGAFPANGDKLLQQLRDILSEKQQVSELENETAEVAAFGGTLLLFYYLDSHTLMELVEQPNGAGYDSFVFISSEKHRNHLNETADQMKIALDDWMSHMTLLHGSVMAANHPNEIDICRYQSIDTAISFLYTGLRFPESVLC